MEDIHQKQPFFKSIDEGLLGSEEKEHAFFITLSFTNGSIDIFSSDQILFNHQISLIA